MEPAEKIEPARVIGRYALYAEIAAGGMATVHIGRLLGPVGFSRMVAIKRMHPQFAKDPQFVSMFLDEARLVARIRHPNVVPTLDVVHTKDEVFLVMDYVQGESLARLIRAGLQMDQRRQIPPRIVATILSGALHGLHAAHEARNERGEALGIVHRDVSPQNILVGSDGVTRVLDFGVAKASGRFQTTTKDGQLKGKLAYMAPEQYSGHVSRQTDIYAASVVLWEALASRRLFAAENEAAIMSKVLGGVVLPPSEHYVDSSATLSSSDMRRIETLDEIVLRGLARDPAKRFATAREMALALERCMSIASTSEVGELVEEWASESLRFRAERIAEIEGSATVEMETSSVTALSTANAVTGEAPPPIPNGTRIGRAPSFPIRETEGSQLSSISVTRSGDTTASPPLPRKTALAILLVVLLSTAVFAVFATILVLQLSTPRRVAATQSSADAVAAEQPPITTPVDSTSVASAVVPDAGAALGAIPTAPRASSTHGTTVKKPPTVNCNPPWTIDPATGRKKYKLECPL